MSILSDNDGFFLHEDCEQRGYSIALAHRSKHKRII